MGRSKGWVGDQVYGVILHSNQGFLGFVVGMVLGGIRQRDSFKGKLYKGHSYERLQKVIMVIISYRWHSLCGKDMIA